MDVLLQNNFLNNCKLLLKNANKNIGEHKINFYSR